MEYLRLKKLRLNDEKEDWIEEALSREGGGLSAEDLEGCYILDSVISKNKGENLIIKKVVKGKVVKIEYGIYIRCRFFREEVKAIKDDEGHLWLEATRCF